MKNVFSFLTVSNLENSLFNSVWVERMDEPKPISFEVDRNDGEKLQILYTEMQDKFF